MAPTEQTRGVQRLSGLDAFFLYIETPAMHTHVALTAVLDPSTMPQGYSFERIRDAIASRVHLVPAFRKRAVSVPLHVSHPVWVDDPDYDIAHHVRRAALPAPGSDHELADLTGYIASIPLDRGRPLWEMWVIEGLAGGRIALCAKIHHSAMDGAAAAELMPLFFDLVADPPPEPVAATWVPEQLPDQWELLGEAGVDRLKGLVNIPGLLRRTGEAVAAIRRFRRSSDGPSGGTPFNPPRTILNGAITADRSVAFARLPLDEVKRVKAAHGATVNDILLATCALAVRHYLEDRDALPDQPLLAACPVSVRAHGDRTGGDGSGGEAGGGGTSGEAAGNNRLSVMFSPLHTECADPVEVIDNTRATAAATKWEHGVVGSDTLAQWAEVADPFASSVVSTLVSNRGLAARLRPAISLILSNIPGPPFPVYLGGAEMERAYPMGPVLEGAGLNVTVLSYRDHVDVGFLAATALIPDVWDLADGIPAAFAELAAST